MKRDPLYPNYDGLSENTARTSRNQDIAPNSQDWDQLVAELLEHQSILVGFDLELNGALLIENNLSDLDDAAAARANLGVYSTAEVDALVGGGGASLTVDKINDNAGTMPPGHAVYAKANGHVDSAQANAAGTTECLGLAAEEILTTATGPIQTAGTLVLTTGQWDTITGQTGGLTPGAYYYVSPTASGSLTTTAPTTAGQFVAPVGLAHSTTEMEIRPERAILL